MTVVLKNDNVMSQSPNTIIVIGSGPVAVHFINETLKRAPNTCIKVFGDEPWEPYNRVSLSKMLHGQTSYDDLIHSNPLLESSHLQTYWNNRIESIDEKRTVVLDSLGVEHAYAQLILALGSTPRIPSISGVNLKNVFTFRDLNDTQALISRQVSSRRTVVIGSGLLGLEAARAMQRYNTEVTCIEFSTRLMFRQLDDEASVFLSEQLENLGIQIKTNARVSQINGEQKVESVTLATGEILECDTVILSAGITPNIELARRANIHFSKGIRVDEHLKTNIDNIYAIGDCAEYEEQIYGLLAPGYEQASVLADNLTGGSSHYRGSTVATQLKVLDYPVFSMGETGENTRQSDEYIYRNRKKNIYRKLIIVHGRLQGAIATGEWRARNRVQEAIAKQRRTWFWQKSRFLSEGELWSQETDHSILEWPDNATVCNCTNVNCGTLRKAMKAGSTTVDTLRSVTGASSVCGSCLPLLQELTQSNEPLKAVTGSYLLWTSAVITLITAFIFYLLPSASYSSSVQASFQWDKFWINSLYKQISGFSLLALSLLILLLSLRKRLKAFSWGSFDHWRLIHVVVGALTFVLIFLHTGFRAGSNLNFFLMLFFTSLLMVGAIASLVISQAHRLPQRFVTQIRGNAVWAHILLFWPVPVFLGFHVLKTYYF